MKKKDPHLLGEIEDISLENIPIKNGTFQLGVCCCCGKRVSYHIWGDTCLNWFCSGERINPRCENYGKEHNINTCRLKQRKRKKYQTIIRKIFFSILNDYGHIKFILNTEIIKALGEGNLDKLDITMLSEEKSDFVICWGQYK
jgi:hypothetical protein